jgi:hypothetical protein
MRPLLAMLLAAPLLAAGCVSAPSESEAAVATSATTDPASTDTPFTFDGSYGPIVFACPMITCTGVDPSSARWADLDFEGNLTALSLTMSWDAATPLMSTLRFGISWDEGENLEYVEGTSPLLLELDGLNITTADKPYIWTWMVTPSPLGIVHVATPQDYKVEGTLTTTGAP